MTETERVSRIECEADKWSNRESVRWACWPKRASQNSIESQVDNPESTIESFNRQFQLGKTEKEAVEWAWPLEAGDTMFCSFLSLLKQMIKWSKLLISGVLV